MKRKRIAALVVAVMMTSGSILACKAPVSTQPDQTAQTTKQQVQNEPKSILTAEYVREFSSGETDGLKIVQGQGNIKAVNGILEVLSKENDETIIIDKKTSDLHNSEAEFVFDPKNDNKNGLYGIIFRYAEDGSWTFIGQDGHSAKDPILTSWVMCTSDGKKEHLLTDGQRIYANREKPYTMKVRLIDNTVTLFLDNVMIFSGEVAGMTQGSGKTGLLYRNGSGANIKYLAVSKSEFLIPEKTDSEVKQKISSDVLSVNMDTSFPRVVDYTLTTSEAKLYGQETPFYIVEINNNRYRPDVTSDFKRDSVTYHIAVKELDVTFDATYKVDKNVLRMELSNIKDEKIPVKTINFPNQSMVSMRSTQPKAQLRVNNYRFEAILPLEETYTQRAYQTTSLATLSCDDIAASINNSNINNRQEVAYQTTKRDKYYTTGLWTNEFQYRGLDNKPINDLWTSVAITGDRNSDNLIDYQDAAIARRDDIGIERLGSKEYRNSFSMIAMDVGSIAQYPFLRILDNIKKFNAGTDGFEQMILIKGYQSEGHDSSHPDYANISKKAGGKEDFMTLLNEAGNYGAKIGVHINHTEAYPEATQYSDKLISETLGWTWYDDSYHIIRENDLLDTENGYAKRLDDLYTLTEGKLSMIYVDTYQDSRWQADSIAEKIHDLGWILGTEYSEELTKVSTWSHTINSKGIDYNTVGNLVRFVDNQTKDIFGNSPLFRGLVNRNADAGFNGWQECKSYDVTIENFYTQVLPQRYLANFPINKWESKDKVYLGTENQVVTEMVGGVNHISKDGFLIAEGNTVFIPWSPEDESKIYHWNEKGGSTTWTLPKSWNNVDSIKYYTLTDEGRTKEATLPVSNHTVTLEADAKVGYVIYKGTDTIAATNMTAYNWGQGSPVKDMGFDSHTFGYGWEKSSTSENTDHIQFLNNALADSAEKNVADNNKGNTHIYVQGKADATLTQTMENLIPEQSYSASIFMEGSEGRKLSLGVITPDGNTVTNYADDFTVAYGNPHNDRFGTYYQRVKLTFTQPKDSTTAQIYIKADPSEDEKAWAAFDNVRVTPVEISDPKGHDFYEDFENVDQEFGPFVCPTKSTQSHLSERNGDLTKDVIDGTYSLKIRGNGNAEQKFNHMRTVSHRLRLLPNTTYTFGLEYMITDVLANEPIKSGNTAFVIGVKSDKAAIAGDNQSAVVSTYNCKTTDNKPQTTGDITFTTGDYDDYYIDLMDSTYSYEFVVDNFYLNKK